MAACHSHIAYKVSVRHRMAAVLSKYKPGLKVFIGGYFNGVVIARIRQRRKLGV
jgi:hypothetical protein